MHLLSTHQPPALQPLATIRLSEQRLHLLRRPRPQTRDIAIKYQTKGNQRDDIGEEEVDRSIPEVIRCDDGEQGPKEEDGDEAGDGAGLELEYPR